MQRQVFADGISVVVVDLDYSNNLMTNALFHSYDASLIVAPPKLASQIPSASPVSDDRGGVIVSCKTRRVDALHVPLSSIRDVRRRSMTSTETGLPCVEVDFEANASVWHSFFGNGSASSHQTTRSLRLVCQIHRDQRQCDIVFGAILGAWRLTQGTTMAPPPALPQSPHTTFRGYGAANHLGASTSRLRATASSFLGAKVPSTDLGRWDRIAVERSVEQSPTTSHVDRVIGATSNEGHTRRSAQAADVAVNDYADEETDRMLDTCADLEMQLRRIQQRRLQRQQLLVSLDCRTSTSSESLEVGSSLTTSNQPLRYFQHITPHTNHNNKAQVYDPSAVADGFAAMCPHCGIYSGAEHKDSCPQRTVQCMRCLSHMRLREFPLHASICVKQAAATNANHFTLSPDAYLNGTSVPDGIKPSTQRSAVTAVAPAAAADAKLPTTPTQQAAAVSPPTSKTPLLERNISFSEIPRVQSIIVKKEEKSEPPPVRTKSLRFVGDDSASNSDHRRTSAVLPRRRSTTNALPDDEPSPAVTTIQCQWCKKYAPPDHPRKCAERRVLCTLCHEEVFLRDKKEHRIVCEGSPTRYASTRLSPERKPSGRAASEESELGDEDIAYERRIKKLESYRQRLDVLRRANAENGTPSHGHRVK